MRMSFLDVYLPVNVWIALSGILRGFLFYIFIILSWIGGQDNLGIRGFC